MNGNMLTYEMAVAVLRERMDEIARLRQMESVALAGQDGGHRQRARMGIAALVRRMGRPARAGSAPAAGRPERVAIEHARQAQPSLTIARF